MNFQEWFDTHYPRENFPNQVLRDSYKEVAERAWVQSQMFYRTALLNNMWTESE